MFKFKIGDIVLYNTQHCKIMNRLYKECLLIKGGSKVDIHYDLSTMDVEIFESYVTESELKLRPKYTITVEDNSGNKNIYHVKDIVNVGNSSISFTPDKTIINDIEVDKVLGIKFMGGLHE